MTLTSSTRICADSLVSSYREDITKDEGAAASEPTKRVWTKKERIILLVCLISQFLSNVIASLPAPFLPSLDESHNFESNITGWIIGLLPLTQLIVCPFYGKLASYVPLKTLLITGLVVTGSFTIAFGMLEYLPLPDASDETVDSLYLCLEILLRIFQSLGAGAILISAMTSLTVTFTDNTTTVLGYAQTAIGFGYLIGPAVGSGLFKLGGFAAIFATVGAIMVLVGIIAWLIFPKNDPAHTENENSVSVRKILFHKNVIAALSLTAFLGTLWSSIEPILEPELREEYGLKQEISALTFLLVSVTFTIGSPIIAIALDKLSWLTPLFVMMCGFVINTVAFLFLGPCPLFTGFTRPLWLVLLCLAFMGLGIALELVSSLDLLGFSSTDETGKKVCLDKSSKALLSAFWSSAYALGDFIGPTYSGIMTEYVSFGWTMTAYALACFFVVFIVVFVQTYKCLVKLGAKNTLADEDDETLPLLL